MEELPAFTYHPDPVGTGMIVSSKAICECCGKARGYTYKSNVYCAEEVEHVCPWCIANGFVAEKFNASFADSHALSQDGIDVSIVAEVTQRTPGYESWQSEVWLSHCDDACEFHGDASPEDVRAFAGEERRKLLAEHHLSDEDWARIIRHYQPAGQPALYKFICRHCGVVRMHMDYT